MATIKSFSDLEQSKKLAEILPLESADMHRWKRTWRENDYAIGVGHSKEWQEGFESKGIEYIPCWSLAALLGALPNGIVMNKDSQNGRYHSSSTHVGTYVIEDNPIDACVAMIEKLHELNLL